MLWTISKRSPITFRASSYIFDFEIQALWESQIFNLGEKMSAHKGQRILSGSMSSVRPKPLSVSQTIS